MLHFNAEGYRTLAQDFIDCCEERGPSGSCRGSAMLQSMGRRSRGPARGDAGMKNRHQAVLQSN